MGTYPAERLLLLPLVAVRSPRVPAGGSLLEPENPVRVAEEGANPFRKERRDHSEVMLIRPPQVHESSTNDANQEQIRDEMLVEISTLLIHTQAKI